MRPFNFRQLPIAFLVFIFLFYSNNSIAANKYVRAGATGSGLSPATASGNLQLILSSASQSDKIYITEGTYAFTTGVAVKTGMEIYGGYSSDFSVRNPAVYVSFLQGNGNTPMITTVQYAVLILIDGVTFRNGGGVSGGAVYVNLAKVVINNCKFINNHTTRYGGAATVMMAEAIFSNCSFENNSATEAGGAVHERRSYTNYNNCIFTNNNAGSGGAISILGTTNTNNFNDCIFTANKSQGEGTFQYYDFCNIMPNYHGGGAIRIDVDVHSSCDPFGGRISAAVKVRNSRFFGNSAISVAAIHGSGEGSTILEIESSQFRGNQAAKSGIIVTSSISSYTLLRIVNSEITGNYIANTAGISMTIGSGSGQVYIVNSTIANNRININSGGCTLLGFEVQVQNSIIYGNSGKVLYISNYDTLLSKNNIISSPISILFGNTEWQEPYQDPKFENPILLSAAPSTEGNYGLLPCSPAVNTGNNTYLPPDIITDLYGGQRKWSSVGNTGIVDIGAHELQGNPGVNDAYYYVDSSISIPLANQDGKTWATAFKHLGYAILNANFSSCVQAIYVAKGTYYPNDGANSSRDASFYIGMGAYSIIGGYPSGGGLRNLAANPTILSGNLANKFTNSDNAYHVFKIFIEGRVEPFVLDGFTIEDGNANENSVQNTGTLSIPRHSGAGIYASNSNYVLKNCILKNNISITEAGAIYLTKGSLKLENCTLEKNVSNVGGALVISDSAVLDQTNSRYIRNWAQMDGGAILVRDFSKFNAYRCVFDSNYSVSSDGGAIRQSNQSCVYLNYNEFKNNVAKYGGAVRTVIGDSLIFYAEGNFFIKNVARENGGAALSLIPGVKGKNILINNLFSKNSTNTGTDNQSSGGASIVQEGGKDTYIINNTFYADSAKSEVGIGALHFKSGGTNRNLFNNIFYKNYPAVNGNDWTIEPGTLIHASGSNIYGNSNPHFFNEADIDGADDILGTDDDGLKLADCSPVINSGNNSILNIVQNNYDIAGNSRTLLSVVDAGAYEKTYFTSTSSGYTSISTGTETSFAFQKANDTTFYGKNCQQLLAAIVGDGTDSSIAGNTKVSVKMQIAQPNFYVKRSYVIEAENNDPLPKGRVVLYFTQQDFDGYNAVSELKLPLHQNDNDGKLRARIYFYRQNIFTMITPEVSWNQHFQCWQIVFESNGFGEYKLGTHAFVITCPSRSINITSELQGSVYQWQLDKGAGYLDLVNNSSHNNVNTRVLNSSAFPEYGGNKYRCIVDGVPSKEFELKFVMYWTGAQGTVWENNMNWADFYGGCLTKPSPGIDVIIPSGKPAYPVLSTGIIVRSILVESGANVTITASGHLTTKP